MQNNQANKKFCATFPKLAYYKHARSLGAFAAIDCYRLAQTAAALDVKPSAPSLPSLVSYELLNGSVVRLSFQLKIF